MALPREPPQGWHASKRRRRHKNVTDNYDVVFLFGDLNFRLDGKPRDQVRIAEYSGMMAEENSVKTR